jgi:hypothetical protein
VFQHVLPDDKPRSSFGDMARGSAFAGRYRTIDEGAPLREIAAQRAGAWVPDTAWNKVIEKMVAHRGKTYENF